MGCDSESANLSQTETEKCCVYSGLLSAVTQLNFGVDQKYFTSVIPTSSHCVARFYHYKFGLNGTYNVSCISFLKVMLGGSLEHLHLL